MHRTEWMAKWRQHLDDHEFRMENPEAHRTICRAKSDEMLAAGAIDQMEKLEMDELANAAYWHAVETLIDCEPGLLAWGFYDLVPRAGGPRIGKLNGRIYFPEGMAGQMAAQVLEDKGVRRLAFRTSAEVWAMDGMTITKPDGSIYDLVITGQRINGKEYSNIDDPDAYRALLDTAQVALENHDFETYRRARPLLLAAAFSKCASCRDHFALREDCEACGTMGFVAKEGSRQNHHAQNEGEG